MNKDNESLANASSHYGADYFGWQQESGSFGGWAEPHKFKKSIKPSDTVIDFGCGGGFLLKGLTCKRKIGIEPNASAAESVRRLGIQHFFSAEDALKDLGAGGADVIISNHALEHSLSPLDELKRLRPLLKPGGLIHICCPLRIDQAQVRSQQYRSSPVYMEPAKSGQSVYGGWFRRGVL